MRHMKVTDFVTQLDEERIVAAIADAEKRTSGEIRVYISHRAHADALAFARRRFAQIGMTRTRRRNAVLLYLAPRTRRFAVVGDSGVHEKCGDAFWQEVSSDLSAGLREGDFTAAIVRAVGRIGDLLATHFPREAGDRNELPDGILR